MCINKIIIDFLENKVSFEELLLAISEHDCAYLNKKYLMLKKIKNNVELDFNHNSFLEYFHYILDIGDVFYKKAEMYNLLYFCTKDDYNIEMENQYLKKYEIVLKYVPDYLYSSDTSIIFEKMINDIFESKVKNIKKYIKEKCKDLFGEIETKRPRWVQESEWPVKNGVPLKFVKQEKHFEKVTYYFENTDGTLIEIDQFY
ncbi:MAG TPA: hypothetical protein DHU62_04595 [Firmicutes bacterium]|nr:hypothetical protein [Bacillota bacterium]